MRCIRWTRSSQYYPFSICNHCWSLCTLIKFSWHFLCDLDPIPISLSSNNATRSVLLPTITNIINLYLIYVHWSLSWSIQKLFSTSTSQKNNLDKENLFNYICQYLTLPGIRLTYPNSLYSKPSQSLDHSSVVEDLAYTILCKSVLRKTSLVAGLFCHISKWRELVAKEALLMILWLKTEDIILNFIIKLFGNMFNCLENLK